MASRISIALVLVAAISLWFVSVISSNCLSQKQFDNFVMDENRSITFIYYESDKSNVIAVSDSFLDTLTIFRVNRYVKAKSYCLVSNLQKEGNDF